MRLPSVDGRKRPPSTYAPAARNVSMYSARSATRRAVSAIDAVAPSRSFASTQMRWSFMATSGRFLLSSIIGECLLPRPDARAAPDSTSISSDARRRLHGALVPDVAGVERGGRLEEQHL